MISLQEVDGAALAIFSFGAMALFGLDAWRARKASSETLLAASFPSMFASVLYVFSRGVGGPLLLSFFAGLLAWMTVLSATFVILAALRKPNSFTLGPSFVAAALPAACGLIAVRFGAPPSAAASLLFVSIAAGCVAFIRTVLALTSLKARVVR